MTVEAAHSAKIFFFTLQNNLTEPTYITFGLLYYVHAYLVIVK